MCLSFPGRVVALTEVGAVVQCHDRVRRASTLLIPDIRVGEFVAVAAGTVVSRLTKDEAADLRALIEGATGPLAEPAAGTVSTRSPGHRKDVQ